MGVNYLEDGAEKSDADKKMGIYGEEFKVFVPVNIPAGLGKSVGFSIQFYNPISSIKYTVPEDNYTRVPYETDIHLLDPAPSGTGEWVKITVPKWDYNWVEFYVPFAEPFTFEFGYTLPLEFGKDVFGMDYSLAFKKWYIPASGVPYFNMSLEGTPRRVQFTFNNTDIEEYQPPPCFVDWPDGALDGVKRFSIKHCPNISEGLYDVVMSAWNPVDGWFSAKPTKVEVLSRIGPITIDDFLVLSDMVREFYYLLQRNLHPFFS